MSEWEDKVREYRAAGFSYDQISAEAARRQQEYAAAGFTAQQITEYFGNVEPEGLYDGVDAFAKEMVKPEETEGDGPQQAKTLKQSFEAGFDVGAVGLIGGRPDMFIGADAKLLDRLAYGLGMTVSDLPISVVGAAAGGAGGTLVAPGAGTAIGGGAGALAVPEAVRSTYLQYYEKGQIAGPRDFLDRLVTTSVDTVKMGIVGGFTGGLGRFAQVSAAARGAGRAGQTTAQLAAEAGAMVTASAAVEGQLPTKESVIDAAAMLVLTKAGMKGGAGILRLQKTAERNLMRHWRDTGELPAKAAERAAQDAAFRERMLLKDPTLDTDNVVLRDGDGVEMTVRKTPVKEAPEGKATPVDPTGETSPADTVLASFEKRDTKASFEDTLHTLYKEQFNEAHPFNRMVDAIAGDPKALDGVEVKTLMESTYYSAPRAEFAMKRGFPEKNLPGLDDIIPKDASGLKDFRALVGALHAEELHQKGVVNPVDRPAAQEVIRTLGKNKDLVKRAKQFTDFNNAMLDELVAGGIITRETADGWVKEFKFYAPFNRVLEEAPAAGVGAGGKRVFNPKKQQKGSEKNILDPVESTVRNAYAVFQAADRNRAANALLDLVEANPEAAAGWVKEKPLAKVKIDVTDAELTKFGVMEDTMTLWRTARAQAGKNDLVVYRTKVNERTGKESVQVKVLELDPEVAAFIGGLDKTDLGIVGKMLEVPNRLLKGGITLSPEFPIVQVLRDNPWQFVFDPKSKAPFHELVVGVSHMFGDTPEFQRWQREGGALSTIRNLGDTYNHGDFMKRYDLRAGQWATVRNVVKSPLMAAKVWADFWANAPRVGTFVRELESGASSQAALKAARRSQLDFMRQGSVARQINKIVPFYSPTMNALQRTVEGFRDNPMPVLAKGAAVITLPVLTAWAAYHEEDWYKEMPQWQKDMSIPIRIGDTTYLIPLPPGIGVLFGGLPRRLAEAFMDKNPTAAKGMAESLLVSFTPAIQVSAFAPIVEQMANYSFFRKRPLVPDSLKGALPEDQYTAYTSETAIMISRALSDFPILKDTKLSPIVIENYVRQWLGSAGKHALKIADNALIEAGVARKPRNRPTQTLADAPFISRFVARYPSSNAASVTEFYDNLRAHDAVMKSIRLTQGRLAIDPKAPERLKELITENQREMLFLAGARDTLSEMRDLIEMIEANPTMDPDEKRRLIDQSLNIMIVVARRANETFEKTSKALEASKKETK